MYLLSNVINSNNILAAIIAGSILVFTFGISIILLAAKRKREEKIIEELYKAYTQGIDITPYYDRRDKKPQKFEKQKDNNQDEQLNITTQAVQEDNEQTKDNQSTATNEQQNIKEDNLKLNDEQTKDVATKINLLNNNNSKVIRPGSQEYKSLNVKHHTKNKTNNKEELQDVAKQSNSDIKQTNTDDGQAQTANNQEQAIIQQLPEDTKNLQDTKPLNK